MATDVAETTITLLTEDSRQRWRAFEEIARRLRAAEADYERACDAASTAVVDAILAGDTDVLRAIASSLRGLQAGLLVDAEGRSADLGRLRQLLGVTMAALQRLPATTAVAEIAANTYAHQMLRFLEPNGDMATQQLLELMDVHPSEISRTGGRLAHRGLVTRARAGKETWWAITDRGREVLNQLKARTAPGDSQTEQGPSAEMAVVAFERAVAAMPQAPERSRLLAGELLLGDQLQELNRRLPMWEGVREFTSEAPDYRVSSPVASTEERRAELLTLLSEVASEERVADFSKHVWTLAMPVNDAYAVLHGDHGAKGLLLIDAKTSPQEFKHPPLVLRNRDKVRQLERTISSTRNVLGATGRWGSVPDPALRITFLRLLREHLDLPTWLLNLYFVSAPEHSRLDSHAPRSDAEWKKHVAGAFAAQAGLGLPLNHQLSPFIRHEFVLEPEVSDTGRQSPDDDHPHATLQPPPAT